MARTLGQISNRLRHNDVPTATRVLDDLKHLDDDLRECGDAEYAEELEAIIERYRAALNELNGFAWKILENSCPKRS